MRVVMPQAVCRTSASVSPQRPGDAAHRLPFVPKSLGYHLHGLRPAILLVSLLLVSSALAEDARVSFLAKQMKGAKDPRVRAQTVAILAATGKPEAIQPLCDALKD